MISNLPIRTLLVCHHIIHHKHSTKKTNITLVIISKYKLQRCSDTLLDTWKIQNMLHLTLKKKKNQQQKSAILKLATDPLQLLL